MLSIRTLLMVYSFLVTLALMVAVGFCHPGAPSNTPQQIQQQGTNIISVLEQKSDELNRARKGARFAQQSIIKSTQKHNKKKDALLKQLLKENQETKEELRSVLNDNAKLIRKVRKCQKKRER